MLQYFFESWHSAAGLKHIAHLCRKYNLEKGSNGDFGFDAVDEVRREEREDEPATEQENQDAYRSYENWLARNTFSEKPGGDPVAPGFLNFNVRSICGKRKRVVQSQTVLEYKVSWVPRWVTFVDQRAARRIARDFEASYSLKEEHGGDFVRGADMVFKREHKYILS